MRKTIIALGFLALVFVSGSARAAIDAYMYFESYNTGYSGEDPDED